MTVNFLGPGLLATLDELQASGASQQQEPPSHDKSTVRLINQLHTFHSSAAVTQLVQIKPIGKASNGKQLALAIA